MGRGVLLEFVAGEALFGQQDLLGTDEVVVALQQRGHHLAFPEFGSGQAP
jgi:hypothetical protein